MKQLLLIRHAKSSWADAGMDDFDRPLNERGKSDAPEMAKRLIRKHIKIDAFISSAAKRAQKTSALFMKEFHVDAERMILKKQLYLAPPEIFYSCIAELEEQLETVAIFAHNPGITDFANNLTLVKVDDMPTCSIYALKVDADQWKDFAKAPKTFWFFDYPKQRPDQ